MTHPPETAYLDDPAVGPARETSHPTFVAGAYAQFKIAGWLDPELRALAAAPPSPAETSTSAATSSKMS